MQPSACGLPPQAAAQGYGPAWERHAAPNCLHSCVLQGPEELHVACLVALQAEGSRQATWVVALPLQLARLRRARSRHPGAGHASEPHPVPPCVDGQEALAHQEILLVWKAVQQLPAARASRQMRGYCSLLCGHRHHCCCGDARDVHLSRLQRVPGAPTALPQARCQRRHHCAVAVAGWLTRRE